MTSFDRSYYDFLLLFNSNYGSMLHPFTNLFVMKNTATLKSGSGVTEGHSKWHHLTDRIWLHNSHSLVTLTLTVSELQRDIGYNVAANSQLQLRAELVSPGVIPSNFHKFFTSPKTRVFERPFAENRMIVGLFLLKLYRNVTERVDRETDRQTDSRTRVTGPRGGS